MERPSTRRAVVSGAVAAALGLSVTTLLAALHRRSRSPLEPLGDFVMIASPAWLQRWAIETFGEADRLVLVVAMVLVILGLGALTGLVAVRSPAVAWAVVAAIGAVGVVAVVGDPTAGVLPSVVAVAAGAVTTGVSLHALLRVGQSDAPADRRKFLLAAGGAAGLAVAFGLIGRSLSERLVAALDRSEIVLPAPAEPADPVPDGLPEAITPLVVPDGQFYRIDTAFKPPSVPLDTWELAFTGMVERPFSLTYPELLALPMIERHVTIACVSNEVGGRLVGNATWMGVPLADLLGEARPLAAAGQVVGRSVDGWTAGFPTELAFDGRDAMVAVAMNGEPLPVRHGFPARLIIPGLFGYVSATKWLAEVELTTWDGFDAYWVPRGWAKEAPMKTQSRIDRPASGAGVRPGEVVFAGVAWATHRGISAVEVRLDDGDWQPANLSPSMGIDAWRQWSTTLDVGPGRHLIRVRAADGTGEFQGAAAKSVLPDGAEGYHMVRFTAGDGEGG